MDFKRDLRLLFCALSLRPHLLLMLNYKKQVKQKKNPSLLYCLYFHVKWVKSKAKRKLFNLCLFSYFPLCYHHYYHYYF